MPELRPSLFLTVLSLAGCGAPGPEDIAAARPLVYALPEPNPASYAFSDTAEFVIDAGAMGPITVGTAQEGRAVVEFRAAPDGLRADVSFPRLHVTFTTAQGQEGADGSELEGPVGVSVAPSGRTAVVDTPAIGPALSAMTGVETLVRPFFVHLPARPAQVGASWTDTVDVREESGDTRTVGQSIVTTTLAGDTLVDERWVLLLRTRSENALTVTGVSGGVEIEQEMAGTTVGLVLWDPRASLLVERSEEGELAGALQMPGATVRGLPISGTVRRTLRLEP